jgi:hypothetical protein
LKRFGIASVLLPYVMSDCSSIPYTNFSSSVETFSPMSLPLPVYLGNQFKLRPGETKQQAFDRIMASKQLKQFEANLAPVFNMTEDNIFKAGRISYQAHVSSVLSWIKTKYPNIKTVTVPLNKHDWFWHHFCAGAKNAGLDPIESSPISKADLVFCDWGTNTDSCITDEDVESARRLGSKVFVLALDIEGVPYSSVQLFERTYSYKRSTFFGPRTRLTTCVDAYFETTYYSYSFFDGYEDTPEILTAASPPDSIIMTFASIQGDGCLPFPVRTPMEPLTKLTIPILAGSCTAKFKIDGQNVFYFVYYGGLYTETYPGTIKTITSSVLSLVSKTFLPDGTYQFERTGDILTFSSVRLKHQNYSWKAINDMIRKDPISEVGFRAAETFSSIFPSTLRLHPLDVLSQEGWVFIMDGYSMTQYYYKCAPTIDMDPVQYEKFFKKKAPSHHVIECDLDGNMVKERKDKLMGNPSNQIETIYAMSQLSSELVSAIYNYKIYAHLSADVPQITNEFYANACIHMTDTAFLGQVNSVSTFLDRDLSPVEKEILNFKVRNPNDVLLVTDNLLKEIREKLGLDPFAFNKALVVSRYNLSWVLENYSAKRKKVKEED